MERGISAREIFVSKVPKVLLNFIQKPINFTYLLI